MISRFPKGPSGAALNHVFGGQELKQPFLIRRMGCEEPDYLPLTSPVHLLLELERSLEKLHSLDLEAEGANISYYVHRRIAAGSFLRPRVSLDT